MKLMRSVWILHYGVHDSSHGQRRWNGKADVTISESWPARYGSLAGLVAAYRGAPYQFC